MEFIPVIIALLLPFASLAICFFNKKQPRKFRLFNNLLIVAVLLQFLPMLLAVGSWAFSGFNGSIWSEGGEGHGTYLWFYLFLFPIVIPMQLVLIFLKLRKLFQT